jgi:hypothetical protein
LVKGQDRAVSEGLLARLGREGWLRPGFLERDELAAGRPDAALLKLCDAGALVGGLSVALDVRPDELVGALCTAIGGTARSLRVVDVRERPRFTLVISYAGAEERWEISDAPGLAHNLNDLLRGDAAARAVAVLGQWEDSHQLWCVPKERLPQLKSAPYFRPENARELGSLAVQ